MSLKVDERPQVPLPTTQAVCVLVEYGRHRRGYGESSRRRRPCAAHHFSGKLDSRSERPLQSACFGNAARWQDGPTSIRARRSARATVCSPTCRISILPIFKRRVNLAVRGALEISFLSILNAVAGIAYLLGEHRLREWIGEHLAEIRVHPEPNHVRRIMSQFLVSFLIRSASAGHCRRQLRVASAAVIGKVEAGRRRCSQERQFPALHKRSPCHTPAGTTSCGR